MTVFLKAGASALVMALSGTAHAADAAIDDTPDNRTITVTATRLPQAVSEVPAIVTVIDADRIADELASDVRDIVRFEPGVSVRRAPSRFGAALGATGRGGNEGFNIRGIEGNRVLIQVDGIRVPEGFSFGAQSAGRGDYVDLGLVKSIEILRGPASALYGSDGLAGAVSFITSDPRDFLRDGETFAGLLRAGYDSADDEFTETAIGVARTGDFSVLGAYTRRDGHELKNNRLRTATSDVPDSRRTAPNPQDTASNAALAKLVWQPSDTSRLRLTVEHLDTRVTTEVLSGRAPPPTPPATLAATAVLDLDARDTVKRDRISLDWTLENGGLDYIHAAIFWQNGRNSQFSREDRNTAADRTRLNTFDNRVFGGGFDARQAFATGAVRHNLMFGGDYSITRQRGLRDGTVPTPPDVFPTRAFPTTDWTLAGLFVGDQIVIGDGALRLFPALRYDFYKIDPRRDPLIPGFFQGASQDGDRMSPKFGAVVKLAGPLSAFGNYARGFKAPSPVEINSFFDNPSGVPFAYRTLRNPDLRPETSETFEAGLRVASDAIDATVTGFWGRYRNFISQVQVSGAGTVADPVIFQYRNLNRVKINGIEGKVEARLPGGLTANAAIAYANGDQFDSANARLPLPSVDPLKLVLGIGYRHPSNSFGGQIIGTHAARKSVASVAGLCAPQCFRPDEYTIIDATAFVRIAERFTLRAGIFNILDRRYIEYADARGLASTSTITDVFTQPGRNVSASLSVRF